MLKITSFVNIKKKIQAIFIEFPNVFHISFNFLNINWQTPEKDVGILQHLFKHLPNFALTTYWSFVLVTQSVVPAGQGAFGREYSIQQAFFHL